MATKQQIEAILNKYFQYKTKNDLLKNKQFDLISEELSEITIKELGKEFTPLKTILKKAYNQEIRTIEVK